MYQNDANGGFKYLMLYLSKINKDIPALFQYPKKNFLSNDTIRYDRKPMGVNKQLSMMKEISKAAGPSKVYTNHCLLTQQLLRSSQKQRSLTVTSWQYLGKEAKHHLPHIITDPLKASFTTAQTSLQQLLQRNQNNWNWLVAAVNSKKLLHILQVSMPT